MTRFGAVIAVAALLACTPAGAASPAQDSGPGVSDRTVSTDLSSHGYRWRHHRHWRHYGWRHHRHWRHYGWRRGHHYGWRHRGYVHRPVYLRTYRW
jgi:hypothetical protein